MLVSIALISQPAPATVAALAVVALLLALWIDLRFGEPPTNLHPVVWMGRFLQCCGAVTTRQGPLLAFVLGAVAWWVGACLTGAVAWAAQTLLLYLFGVAMAGLPSLLRFVSLWAGGLRPSFDEGAQATWFPIAAGLISTFQMDFAGRLLFWLYDPTTQAMFAIVGAFVLLGALLFAASRLRNLSPVALYIAIYLLVVVVQLAASGKAVFEPRYALPVEGLLLLLGVALAWRWSQHIRRFLRMTSIILSMLAVAVFLSLL